jgi:PhnB protein
MATINPYLNFNGNTEEAFTFYKSIFGGEFSNLSRFKDMPNSGQSESEGNKILHVSLPIGKDSMLMGSDRNSPMGPAKVGDNIHISLSPDSEEEAHRLFNALAEGGKVAMPITKTFWNASFGMLTDKFGIQWMVNYEHPRS